MVKENTMNWSEAEIHSTDKNNNKPGMNQTEIGLLPEDWDVELFLNISNRIGDGIHSTPTYKENEDYFFVNGNNLKNGKVLIDENTKTVSLEQFKIHKRELSNRTILLSINGTIGNIAFFKNEQIILGKSACYINLKNNVNKDFIYFLLQSTSVQKYFEENLTGSTIKNLGLGTISNTKIPLPPLPEQEAIAEALSDADAWIESLEQLIAKKSLIKQGAMQELLSPKEDWEVKKLGEIISSTQLGGNYPNSESETDNPLIKMGNIQRGKISLKKVEYIPANFRPSSKDLLRENDLLFNTRNTLELVGKVCIWRNELQKAYFNSNIMRITFNKDIIASNVLMNAIFNSKKVVQYLKDIATGTTSVAAIYTRDLFGIELSFPKSLSEQTRIATILSDMDAELEALEAQLGKARKVKQGMMQELLTGRVRLV